MKTILSALLLSFKTMKDSKSGPGKYYYYFLLPNNGSIRVGAQYSTTLLKKNQKYYGPGKYYYYFLLPNNGSIRVGAQYSTTLLKKNQKYYCTTRSKHGMQIEK